ncbi:hypothetical protein AB0C87_06085 [Actinomadura sp. NPDC048021]|uniref:hypothetical protein n=1 Tax=Actinomadura sp. NPDC048021 TaxID=3155385 RepID=UPI0033E9E8EB
MLNLSGDACLQGGQVAGLGGGTVDDCKLSQMPLSHTHALDDSGSERFGDLASSCPYCLHQLGCLSIARLLNGRLGQSLQPFVDSRLYGGEHRL